MLRLRVSPTSVLVGENFTIIFGSQTLPPGLVVLWESRIETVTTDGTGVRQMVELGGYAFATTLNMVNNESGARTALVGGLDTNCAVVVYDVLRPDTDGDGYGNACDPDLNNDRRVNFVDISLFSKLFLTTEPHADFNMDGSVNFQDYTTVLAG